ncbi:MAG: DUF1987 domain-containing protein [Magnetococcales bacterium]|nr:DUF1987 domain-containing protein [Magnetococcales bacterium]
MEALSIQATRSTPAIQFDPDLKRLEIRGESYPEDVNTFYDPILSWMETFLQSVTHEDTIELHLKISYFNSSSSKIFLDIFDLLNSKAVSGSPVHIYWHHHTNNEMSREYGEEFREELTAAQFYLVEQHT